MQNRRVTDSIYRDSIASRGRPKIHVTLTTPFSEMICHPQVEQDKVKVSIVIRHQDMKGDEMEKIGVVAAGVARGPRGLLKVIGVRRY